MFPLYGKGEITVYARWESERLIQNGESPVYGYEISETPETFVMTDSLLYFVMDAGVSGTYIFNVPESSTLFILDYDVFYSGVFNNLMDYDMYGNPLNRAYLREGKTYIIVVVDATVFNDDARLKYLIRLPREALPLPRLRKTAPPRRKARRQAKRIFKRRLKI